MEDLKAGEILLHIEDNSPWEFLHYSFGKHTIRAEANLPARELYNKAFVSVKPLKPKSNLTAHTDNRDFSVSLFKKAPVDYVLTQD